MTMLKRNNKLKNGFTKQMHSVSIFASIASVVGFLADLGSPIGNFTFYLMIVSIIIVVVFGVLYLFNRKEKKIWKNT